MDDVDKMDRMDSVLPVRSVHIVHTVHIASILSPQSTPSTVSSCRAGAAQNSATTTAIASNAGTATSRPRGEVLASSVFPVAAS